MFSYKFLIATLLMIISSRVFSLSPTIMIPESSESYQNQASFNTTNTYFEGINKIIVPGISKEDFMDVCAIQWLNIDNDTINYIPQKVNLEKHLSYDEFEILIEKLNKSSITKCFTASATSVDNRKIYMLEIGNGLRNVVFVGGVHAREVANPQFLIKFAVHLANEYENRNPDIIRLLSEYKIIMLPNANPDGYAASVEGAKQVKNKSLFFGNFTDSELAKAKSNANGVDINRNFPSYSASLGWEGNKMRLGLSETKPSLDYFAGYKLGSENETKVLMNFIMRYVPFAYRFVDFHSAGRLIYAGKPHLSDAFNELCHKTGIIIRNITKYTLYSLNNESSGEGTDGTVTDFAAEVAAGFVYNEKIGRLAPPENESLLRKYTCLKYSCSVNTVETLKTSKKEGFGLLQISTPKMQAVEWKKYNLEKLFFSLIRD